MALFYNCKYLAASFARALNAEAVSFSTPNVARTRVARLSSARFSKVSIISAHARQCPLPNRVWQAKSRLAQS